MIAALLGFAAPFLPDLIGMGKGYIDHKQEKELLELRMKHADTSHDHRMDEVAETGAQREREKILADRASARKMRPSFGVQILNAASESKGVLNKWVFSFVFFIFSALDWFISSVRPTITYYVVGLWGAIKVAIIVASYRQTGDIVTTLIRPEIWTEFDQDVLMMILAFWFSDALKRRAAAGAR